MRNISGALAKTSAVVRTATSAFFLPFSEYKVFGSEFTHSGFQQYLQGFIQNGAVSFYQPVLANLCRRTRYFLDTRSESFSSPMPEKSGAWTDAVVHSARKNHVQTAALGCPAERSSAILVRQ